jgi:hypothetical protein
MQLPRLKFVAALTDFPVIREPRRSVNGTITNANEVFTAASSSAYSSSPHGADSATVQLPRRLVFPTFMAMSAFSGHRGGALLGQSANRSGRGFGVAEAVECRMEEIARHCSLYESLG